MGTAITTLVRKADHEPTSAVEFRNLWGRKKPEQLIATADAEPDALYSGIEPVLPLGLPFVETAVSPDWFDWPALPELFPVSFPGVQTKRDSFLIDIDLDRVKERVKQYFDPDVSHERIAQRYAAAMKSSSGFVVRDARSVRRALVARGGPKGTGFVRHAYRPFDTRWLYWEGGHGLLGRPVPGLHVPCIRREQVLRDATETAASVVTTAGHTACRLSGPNGPRCDMLPRLAP